MIHMLFRLYYETVYVLRNANNYLNTITYYVIVLLMFPVGLNFQSNTLYLVNIPIICVCLFLIILSSLDGLFTYEANKGHLFEYHFVQKRSIAAMVTIKMLMKWLSITLCISVGTCIGFVLFNIDLMIMPMILMVLVPTILVLITIGSIGSSLLVGYKQKGMLLSVIVAPFYIPVLILTVDTLNMCLQGVGLSNQNIILVSIVTVLVCASPVVCAYTLKMWSD
uniref:ABC transporter channel subunit n=1 Tax=Histiona aroides TaxID=392300 RepID=M4QD14_HISAR|nr:ABC transporter channel subunit [Histiona aroides]AGH24080.1 ABC transporter channel subunit [Histiona aroides]